MNLFIACILIHNNDYPWWVYGLAAGLWCGHRFDMLSLHEKVQDTHKYVRALWSVVLSSAKARGMDGDLPKI